MIIFFFFLKTGKESNEQLSFSPRIHNTKIPGHSEYMDGYCWNRYCLLCIATIWKWKSSQSIHVLPRLNTSELNHGIYCLSLKKQRQDDENESARGRGTGRQPLMNHGEAHLILLKPAWRQPVSFDLTPEMIHLRSVTWNNLRFSKPVMRTQIIAKENQKKSLIRPHLFSPPEETTAVVESTFNQQVVC